MNPIRRHLRRAGRRAALAVLSVFAIVGAGLIAPSAAMAAVPGGPATVSTTVDFVSGTDLSTPITELKATPATSTPTDLFALNIGYVCGPAAPCEDVTIAIAPQPLDSTYGQYRFARYWSATLPAGASIAGNDTTGHTVTIGDLPAGATGSFTVSYRWQDRPVGVSPQSFFLDGQQITNTVTIDAANAGATATASDSLTWHIDTMEPLVAFAPQGLARGGVDYDYHLRMASDCMWYRSTANHGEPAKLCAASYETSFHLPDGVEYVAASHDGTYDAAARTVTWSESGVGAAPGWGSVNGFSRERTVTVRFPDAMFDAGCTIDVSATLDAQVTYLDGETKQAETATVTHQATNCEPFAAVNPLKKTSTRNLVPNIVWDSGVRNTWYLDVGNRANVPGVAVITDEGLDQIDGIRVYQVVATNGTIAYELDNGITGTASGTYNTPAGREIASVVITSPVLDGPNLDESSQTKSTDWRGVIRYETVGSAPADGWERSNTASAVMTYPDYALGDIDAGTATSEILITPRPANFTATLTATRTGQGNPVAGVPVDYRVGGVTTVMEDDATLEPQYVFVAPYQWDIVDDSWSLEAGAPAGAIFTRSTVTISGEDRDSLLVSWPAGTNWGVNASWPGLKVQATPGAAASAGSIGVAYGMVGDATHSFPGYTATWGGGDNRQKHVDSTDVDGDGDVTESFAWVNASTTVGASAALTTLKEICLVDDTAADGCDWIADSAQKVPVSPVADDIKYRVTLRNNGSTALSNVVAYDVLPHPGDTGISSGSASVPRGSEFSEALAAVSDKAANIDLLFSESTNPCRAEVFAGGPTGCDDDWSPAIAGATSIRAEVNGTLAPGASASFVYTADVLGTPGAGALACNSIATAATGVPVSEPSPVCVAIQAADLAVTATPPTDVQIDRPTALAFTVANVAGTEAPGAVTVNVPAGVEVSSLAFGDWTCTAAGAAAPIVGPAALSCDLPAPLAEDASIAMELPVIVRGSGVAVTTTVAGDLFDPDLANNSAAITLDAAPAAAGGLTVTKDDSQSALVAGQETTYTIGVANQLIAEDVSDVTIVDTLPAGVEFVSASAGGAHSGGTVTWQVPALQAAASTTVTVTVRVAADATVNSIVNTVTAQAADPAFPGETLTGTATDVDQIDRIALTKTAQLRAPADPADPRPGDVVEYTFLVANNGGGTLTEVAVLDPMPGLSVITYPDGWPTTAGTLGAGESVTGVATYTLSPEDIDSGSVANEATVEGLSAGGEQVADSDSVDFLLPAAGGIAFTKDAQLDTTGVVQAGDVIEYTFTAENTGNVTLDDVTIDDALAGLSDLDYTWPGAAQTLGSGETVTATATYVLTQADIDRGSVVNTASASGTPSGGDPFVAEDSATVTIPAAPAATLKKTGETHGDADRPVAGDEVEFTFDIENTGNVTLSTVEIADHLAGVSDIVYTGSTDSLVPGATVQATATYTLSQTDIDAGEVENTATLTAAPARGTMDPVDAEAVVPLASAPGLVVTKSAALDDGNGDGKANPGEKIRYSFELENTGNVTLAEVTVDDPKVVGIAVTDALAPGQIVTVTADPYTVTDADAAAGTVDNTATAFAASPDDEKVTADASSVSVDAAPSGDLATTGAEWNPTLLMFAGGAIAAGLVLLVITMLRRRRQIRD